MPNYGEVGYWNKRYKEQAGTTYDWLLNYPHFRDIVRNHLLSKKLQSLINDLKFKKKFMEQLQEETARQVEAKRIAKEEAKRAKELAAKEAAEKREEEENKDADHKAEEVSMVKGEETEEEEEETKEDVIKNFELTEEEKRILEIGMDTKDYRKIAQ
jgi:flagellar biosynthesis GTPase FlhF